MAYGNYTRVSETRWLTYALLTAFVLPGGLVARKAHAVASDEKKVEAEIDDEDDGSPPAPDINRHESIPVDDGLPLTPPPVQTELVPPPDGMVTKPTEAEHQAPPAEAQPARLHEEENPYDGTSRATTSGRGEPIFDWSKHVGEQEVEHPFAAKGLTRITKDRLYLYKLKESPQDHAASFHVGYFHPDNLSNPEEAGQPGSTFKDNYQKASAPALMFDYEWQPWRTAIGKIGIKAGSGAFIAQGNGHFVVSNNNPNAGLTPREVFTFAVVPLNLGAVYRLQFWHRQMVVPYGEGGGTLFGFTEFRDDNKPPKFGGSFGAYFAGGLALNMSYFDALSRIALDREYGINAVYLTVEFRQIVSITKRYDFTSDLVNAGFLMEY